MRIFTGIVAMLLMVILCTTPAVYAGSLKTYTNGKYGFTLEYPSDCKIKAPGRGDFDIVHAGEAVLSGSVQDESFRIFNDEYKGMADVFQEFAWKRSRIVCGADGPDGTSYCSGFKSEKQFTLPNGLRVFELYLNQTREDYSTNTRSETTVGPVYMVDISRPDRPLALLVFPGYGMLASEESQKLAREVVESIKLLEKKD